MIKKGNAVALYATIKRAVRCGLLRLSRSECLDVFFKEMIFWWRKQYTPGLAPGYLVSWSSYNVIFGDINA